MRNRVNQYLDDVDHIMNNIFRGSVFDEIVTDEVKLVELCEHYSLSIQTMYARVNRIYKIKMSFVKSKDVTLATLATYVNVIRLPEETEQEKMVKNIRMSLLFNG